MPLEKCPDELQVRETLWKFRVAAGAPARLVVLPPRPTLPLRCDNGTKPDLLASLTLALVDVHSNRVHSGPGPVSLRLTMQSSVPTHPHLDVAHDVPLEEGQFRIGDVRIQPPAADAPDCDMSLGFELIGTPPTWDTIQLPERMRVIFTNVAVKEAQERQRQEEEAERHRQAERERAARRQQLLQEKAPYLKAKRAEEEMANKWKRATQEADKCRSEIVGLAQKQREMRALPLNQQTMQQLLTAMQAVAQHPTWELCSQLHDAATRAIDSVRSSRLQPNDGLDPRDRQIIRQVRERAGERLPRAIGTETSMAEVIGVTCELFELEPLSKFGFGLTAGDTHTLAAVLSDFYGRSKLTKVVTNGRSSADALCHSGLNLKVQPLSMVAARGPRSMQAGRDNTFCVSVYQLLKPVRGPWAQTLYDKVLGGFGYVWIVRNEDEAKAIRTARQRENPPTILALDGFVLESDGSYGGRGNSYKKTRVADLRGAPHFGFDPTSMEEFGLLSHLADRLSEASAVLPRVEEMDHELKARSREVAECRRALDAKYGASTVDDMEEEEATQFQRMTRHTKRTAQDAGLPQVGGASSAQRTMMVAEDPRLARDPRQDPRQHDPRQHDPRQQDPRQQDPRQGGPVLMQRTRPGGR